MSVVLLGLGRYVEEITEIVAKFSEVIVVEREGEKLRSFLDKEKGVENLSVVPGSATDIDLWREKIDLQKIEAVISFLDEERTLDIARVLRRAFGFDGTFVFVAKERPQTDELRDLSIEIVSVPDVLGAILKNLLKGKGIVKYPVGIGLRKGEIAEVLITEGSPAAYLRLRDLIRRKVRIAMIYREGKIILPMTDIRILPGDKLLVVGEPSQVELFVGSITQGEPNFPLRWGTRGVVCKAEDLEEFSFLKERVRVRDWESRCEDPWREEEAGLLVFSEGRYVNDVFENSQIPSILLKGSHPYKNILVSANTEALGSLLPSAIDFGRLFGSRVFVLLVTSIEKMMTKEEKELLESLKTFIERIRRSTPIDIKLIRKEGNPVRETLKLLKGNFNLLALGYTTGRKSRFWRPYTPHILARKSPITTLLIPEVPFER